ncbi:MAG: DUF3990 domain-containing protein [Clostridium sp.]|nr:DUF3990 domain-containing protein [Clostridium sp.]
MTVYHGSNIEIVRPDIVHSRSRLDFGKGFYVTTLLSQAAKWVERFCRSGGEGIINIYQLDEAVWTETKVLRFDDYSGEWLDFITACRQGDDTEEFDLVSGGVANDRVFNTCELYFKQYISKEAAIDRLRYEKPNQQICFKNQQTIEKYLRFEGSERK